MSEAYQKWSPPVEGEPPRRVIEAEHPDGAVTRHPLLNDRLVVGRAADTDLQLDSSSVSRRHLEIFRDPFGRWWARDLGSRNGTRVNGYQVQERLLDLGDRIHVGDCTLVLRAEAADPTHGEPPPDSTDVTLLEVNANVSTLDADAARHVLAAHLALLMELGQQLQRVEPATERLVLLCGMMVTSDFHGACAVVLRISRRAPEPAPRALCPVQARGGSSGGLHVSHSLLRAVQQKGMPALAVTDSRSGSGDAEVSAACGTAALACPLRITEQEMDLLYVTLPPLYGTNEWLNLAALAVEQYRMADSVWAAREQSRINSVVEHDLERAREIQWRLLPRDVRVPGLEVAWSFRPCRWVAGDYVDVIPRPDGRCLLIIADVCGKGLPAALVSSSLHTLVRASVRAGTELLGTAETLNDYLCDYLPDNRFVTAVIAELVPGEPAFELVNLGHPPPLIVSPGGGCRMSAMAEFEPLGLSKTRYRSQRERLEPGQVLMLYTDGLSELEDSSGRMLQAGRLGEHMAALYGADPRQSMAQLVKGLDGVLEGYQSDRVQADDRTFLLAKRL